MGYQDELEGARARIAQLEQELAERRVPPELVALREQVKLLKKQLDTANQRVRALEGETGAEARPSIRPSGVDLDSIKRRSDLQTQFFASLAQGAFERCSGLITELENIGGNLEAEACRKLLDRQLAAREERRRALRRSMVDTE